MTEVIKRIRESAPFRKSMSMSSEDIEKAAELERLFTTLYPDECPFSFSKTISKAIELAYETITSPAPQPGQTSPAHLHVPSQISSDKSRTSKILGNHKKR